MWIASGQVVDQKIFGTYVRCLKPPRFKGITFTLTPRNGVRLHQFVDFKVDPSRSDDITLCGLWI